MNATSASERWAVLVATWFGCGYAPVGPGTAGSLAAIVIAAIVERFWPMTPAWFALLALALTYPGILAADVTARVVGKKDPGLVVVDEVLGQWLTFAGAVTANWKSMIAAFVLFRLFDIWKPWPVRTFESLPGGYGIVADDLMAGVYGALVLYLAGCFNFY